MNTQNKQVAVIIGAGGIGLAIARRVGAGRTVLLAGHAEGPLKEAADQLLGEGFDATTKVTDISDASAVAALADAAAALGAVTHVVHSAGVSPVQASTEQVLHVDLFGTAVILREFGRVIAPGGAGLVVASMAGHMPEQFPLELERALASTPPEELLALPALQPDAVGNSAAAYALAKRGNALQVQAAAVPWGKRGARVNCISPGIILTPLARDEMSGPGAAIYQQMIDTSAAGRVSSPTELAATAAFLLGPEAGFITGSDLLIDGGVVAALRAGEWSAMLP